MKHKITAQSRQDKYKILLKELSGSHTLEDLYKLKLLAKDLGFDILNFKLGGE